MKLTTAIGTFFTNRMKEYGEVHAALRILREFAVSYLFGVHVASVTATGAKQEVSGLPFDDLYALLIVNITTAELTVWIKGMADASALEIAAAAVYTNANGISANSGLSDATIVAKPGSLVLGTAIGANNDVLKLYAVGK